jgi:hypothetical protein
MTKPLGAVVGVGLLIAGAGLIAWNLRDPDAALREPLKEKRAITLAEAPAAVQATAAREAAGAPVGDVQEKRQGSEVKWEIFVRHGRQVTEVEIAQSGAVLKRKQKPARP